MKYSLTARGSDCGSGMGFAVAREGVTAHIREHLATRNNATRDPVFGTVY
ncbi:MAG: hypothetical protein WCB11_25625 [Terriglobales bacterium]|jgi:hypothetical protein